MNNNFVVDGKEYHVLFTYDSFGGGKNNLDIAHIYEKGVGWTPMETGTSVNGKEAAARNAKRNLMRKLRKA